MDYDKDIREARILAFVLTVFVIAAIVADVVLKAGG